MRPLWFALASFQSYCFLKVSPAPLMCRDDKPRIYIHQKQQQDVCCPQTVDAYGKCVIGKQRRHVIVISRYKAQQSTTTAAYFYYMLIFLLFHFFFLSHLRTNPLNISYIIRIHQNNNTFFIMTSVLLINVL